jgi:hypothetical protein
MALLKLLLEITVIFLWHYIVNNKVENTYSLASCVVPAVSAALKLRS